MRHVLQTFSRQSRARKATVGILVIGLLAVGLFSAFNAATGATAARPSPRVGDRFSVFMAKYGQSAKIGTAKGLKVGHVSVNGVRFYADPARTIIVNAQPINGVVKNVVVTGPASWTDKQAAAFCQGFLPSGASAFRTTGPYTYYHSSVGDVVIFNAGHGTCEVVIGPNNE